MELGNKIHSMVTIIDAREKIMVRTYILCFLQFMYVKIHGIYKLIGNHKKLMLGSCMCTYYYALESNSNNN